MLKNLHIAGDERRGKVVLCLDFPRHLMNFQSLLAWRRRLISVPDSEQALVQAEDISGHLQRGHCP